MMKTQVITGLILAVILVLVCSCQESSDAMIKRAQLVGNENLLLKKQLAEKDAQIENLQKQIESIKAQAAADKKKNAQATISSMKLLVDCQKKLAAYEGRTIINLPSKTNDPNQPAEQK